MRESTIKVGDVFHRLTVIEKLPKNEYDTRSLKRTLFKVICQCGVEKVIDAGNLKKGVKSCSCQRNEQSAANGKTRRTVEGYINYLYGENRRSSKNRGLSFELTKDEFKVLITNNCKYCDLAPTLRCKVSTVGIPTEINGIDRVNSDLGYINSNCVSCCTQCNTMKMDYTKTEFLNKIKEIYEFNFKGFK